MRSSIHKHLPFIALLLLSLVGASQPSTNPAKIQEEPEDMMLTCTAEACQLRLTVTVPMRPAAGAPIPAIFELRNVGSVRALYFANTMFDVILEDEQGNNLKYLGPDTSGFSGPLTSIAAGTAIRENHNLRDLFKLPKSGVFYLSVTRTFGADVDNLPTLAVNRVKISTR